MHPTMMIGDACMEAPIGGNNDVPDGGEIPASRAS